MDRFRNSLLVRPADHKLYHACTDGAVKTILNRGFRRLRREFLAMCIEVLCGVFAFTNVFHFQHVKDGRCTEVHKYTTVVQFCCVTVAYDARGRSFCPCPQHATDHPIPYKNNSVVEQKAVDQLVREDSDADLRL